MIELYVSLLGEKQEEIGSRRDILVTGLNKLRDANKTVGELQEEIKALQPILVQKSKETAELLEKVTVDQACAFVLKT